MNDEKKVIEKGKLRFFTVCSLGKNRWYWVVWPSLVEMQTSEEPLLNVGEGYEKTKSVAIELALTLAGKDAEWIAAKYAKIYHRSKAGTEPKESNQGVTRSSNTPVTQEFLYRDVFNTVTEHWDSLPHRVVRKTGKYVYVEQHPYVIDDRTGSWFDLRLPTFRLDRQALEQQGYAFIPVSAYVAETEEPVFFDAPRFKRIMRDKSQLPSCLKALNLTWPCTMTEVKEAYRRLVKHAHPDGGGSHNKFLALQEAYEQALRMCQ
jgi:hypothetical protein